jgi:exonuclease SbcC
VKGIDLLEEKIFTEQNTIISFVDMGTGQSQSAYLVSLLNEEDDRKIIALFDEIAMMDENSLRRIYAKIRDLYQKNRLLMAIFVQKADYDVKIKDLSVGD